MIKHSGWNGNWSKKGQLVPYLCILDSTASMMQLSWNNRLMDQYMIMRTTNTLSSTILLRSIQSSIPSLPPIKMKSGRTTKLLNSFTTFNVEAKTKKKTWLYLIGEEREMANPSSMCTCSFFTITHQTKTGSKTGSGHHLNLKTN